MNSRVFASIAAIVFAASCDSSATLAPVQTPQPAANAELLPEGTTFNVLIFGYPAGTPALDIIVGPTSEPVNLTLCTAQGGFTAQYSTTFEYVTGTSSSGTFGLNLWTANPILPGTRLHLTFLSSCGLWGLYAAEVVRGNL